MGAANSKPLVSGGALHVLVDQLKEVSLEALTHTAVYLGRQFRVRVEEASCQLARNRATSIGRGRASDAGAGRACRALRAAAFPVEVMGGAWRWLLAAVIIGTVLGVFSARGDGIGIMIVNGLANATSPWMLSAFAAGAMAGTPQRGAVAGSVALVVGVWAYYVGFVVEGNAYLLPFLAVWSLAGAVSGGLFGAGGGAWRSRRDRWRTLAVAAVVGALVAEAAHRLILIEIWTGFEWDRTYVQLAAADLVLAAAALLILAERGRRAAAVARALPLAAALLLALYGVDLALRWASDLGIG